MTEPTEHNPFPAPNQVFRPQPQVTDVPPEPSGPKSNRGVLVAAIGGGTAFLAVAAVVVVMALRPGETRAADPPPASAPIPTIGQYGGLPTSPEYNRVTTTPPSTTSPPSQSYPTSSTSVSTSSSVVDRAWRRATGPGGISVEIPATWPVKPGAVPSNVQADSTDVTGDLIRFGGSASPAKTLLASIQENEVNTPTIRNGYQRLQLDLAADGSGAVVWEFLFTAKDGQNRHAIGRFWRLGRTDYVVYISSSVDSWPTMETIFAHLVSTASPV